MSVTTTTVSKSRFQARVALVLAHRELTELQALGQAGDRSVSAEIRRAIRQHVERSKSSATA